ncbi:exopolysaccharide transport family protein [Methylobacterium sp. NEAU 140]|uniref:GumC family protein n=1 Tax=Methylobacterium sp. NEAU 140 TaxID=3064945 RepID=UPI0027374AA9|nr:exopolysaccharide transport family protein [Methylobacterium sp. NEAU 140]MDP4025282.1 exopolysaccharide transport family protein [Methylobacterium sp. NEAU 140]
MAMVERVPSMMVVGGEPVVREEPAADAWYFDPREILRVLRRHWIITLLPVILCALAAVAWIALVPPRYTASVQVLIDPRGLQVVKDSLAPTDQTSDASLMVVDSQMRVMTSDDVYRRVVAALGLARDPEFVPPPTVLDTVREQLGALVGLPAAPDAAPALTALRTLRERTTAKRLERSFVVELGVTLKNRDKAAEIAQAIAKTYLASEAEARADLTRKAGIDLAGRLGELQRAVAEADEQAQKYRATHNIVGTRAQLVSEQQLTQLNEQLGVARARVAELRGRLTQVEALLKGTTSFDAVTEVVQSPTVTQLRAQIAQLEASRADSVQNLGPLHPAVQTSAAQLRTLRGQLDAEIKRIAASITNEYKAAVAKEASLSATLDSRKKEALTVGASLVRLRELERQVDANRAVYETFLVRSRELQEQQRLDTTSSRIISPAVPPERRNGPPSSIVLAAALVAGLGLGVVGALLAEPAVGRIGSRRRLQAVAKLPVMASVPRAVPGSQTSAEALRAKAAYALAVSRIGGRLHREFPGARPPVILVTSADDRDGKTVLAHGIASSAAADGQRTLLVDADPDAILARSLGALPARKLADVLRRQGPPVDAIAETPSGIWLLAIDERALDLGTGAVATAIHKAAASFDTVVVNLGLVGTDAAAERLASDPRFQAVVFAVSAQRSTAAPLRRALDALGREPRLRLVLTDEPAAA